MALDNVGRILSIGSPLDSLKLLCIAGSFSRPRFRPFFNLVLEPFVQNEEVPLHYRCLSSARTIFLRKSEMESDFLSTLELAASDTYNLDEEFHPDLVIDGGGNIGLFTLRVAAREALSGRQPRFVVYEPMLHNNLQCQRHFKENNVNAEVRRACLGGQRRTLPFYCRTAIASSFDPSKPYDSVVDMPVDLLSDAIGNLPAERILIKLDIEGMEVEALCALLPQEKRPIYVVGELHDASVNGPQLEQLFRVHRWSFDFGPVADGQALFHACSPEALPLLPSMMARTRSTASPTH
jgi:FkbM family methyltransferase